MLMAYDSDKKAWAFEKVLPPINLHYFIVHIFKPSCGWART